MSGADIDDIDFEGKIVRETEKAWCVECCYGEVWLPKSVVERCQWEGQSLDKFYVPGWLAREKGWV